MEPNLGIHKYHQKKTNKMLSGKQWLCNGDRLQMSDQESRLNISSSFSSCIDSLDNSYKKLSHN